MEKKPSWLKVRAPGGANYARLKTSLRTLKLHTVCEEARCPNVAECWASGTATIMLLGDVCTRACRFCAVKSGHPAAPDPDEPANTARALAEWGLSYVVLTSVDRDDLPDGGADHYARTVEAIHQACPDLLVETLIPDYLGAPLARVVAARPDVLAHNVETTRALTRPVRDRRCSFERSLDVLREAKTHNPDLITKSSIMVGLGENETEVLSAMADLRSVNCDVLTLGQYLQPTTWHLPVAEYWAPERFELLAEQGRAMGFRYVAAGPLVRSSYKAAEFYIQNMLRNREAV